MSFSLLASELWLKDAGERVGKTFVQAFGAQLIASGWFSVDQITNLSVVQRAGVAGLAAALSVVTSIVSKYVKSPDSASLVKTAEV